MIAHHLAPYIIVSALLFAIGLTGFILRRNLIIMFLSTEVMFQAIIILAVAFGRLHNNLTGQTFALLLLIVAAAEAGVGLALVIVVFRRRESLDPEQLTELKG
jgi:NADH-quinone oxidoreductase subunit K